MKKAAKAVAHPAVRVLIESEVARQVRQHGRSSMKAEVCGVLIGREEGSLTIVEACIAGENAAQGGAHVTFTQDTWEHIYQVKDKNYPDARIVGWYHSHPGFGVFLSDHDLFIHQNFFSSPQQVAWVYDPHSDEEGCFGWRDGSVIKIDDVSVRFGQPVGESLTASAGEEEEIIRIKKPEDDKIDIWPLIRVGAFCLLFFILGGTAAFYYITTKAVLLPRGGNALVLVQDDRVAIIPPSIAEHALDVIEHDAQGQLQMMQPDNPLQPVNPAAPATPAQGGQDGRKK